MAISWWNPDVALSRETPTSALFFLFFFSFFIPNDNLAAFVQKCYMSNIYSVSKPRTTILSVNSYDAMHAGVTVNAGMKLVAD